MAGLSADIIDQLRKVLLRCGPFDSNCSLRAVFTDGRIYAWRDHVPEAGSRAERVHVLIDDLLERTNPQGVPALALFAEVLADRISPGDACHHSLAQIAVDLRAEARSRAPTPLEPVSHPNESRIDTGGGAYMEGNVDVGERGSFVGRDVHGDVVTGEKTTTFDQRGQQVQHQTNVAGDYNDRRGAPTYVTYIEHASGVAIGDGAKAAGVPREDDQGNMSQQAVIVPQPDPSGRLEIYIRGTPAQFGYLVRELNQRFEHDYRLRVRGTLAEILDSISPFSVSTDSCILPYPHFREKPLPAEAPIIYVLFPNYREEELERPYGTMRATSCPAGTRLVLEVEGDDWPKLKRFWNRLYEELAAQGCVLADTSAL